MFNISVATEVGARPYQEDRYLVVRRRGGVLLCIMDGHGGKECAERISSTVVSVWDHLKNVDKVIKIEDRLKYLVNQLQKDCINLESGATFSAVFVPSRKNKIYVAVIGDSPVLVIYSAKDGITQYQLSPEHNARSNMKERAEGEKRGGVYSQGYMWSRQGNAGLQMTRAIGDCKLEFLSREAEIYTLPFPIKAILVASDGVFDPAHGDDALNRVLNQLIAGADAKALVDAAVALPTEDNATAIVCRFE
jgi:serine/threonine protein phosphatase PrpC